MTGGLSVVDSSTGEKTNQRPDCVIWLDKSARPVEWLTRSLWPVLSKGEDDKVPPMPKSYFLNIDREHWVNILDSQGNGGLDVGRIDDSVIRSLRSIFVLPTQKQTGLSPKIDSAKTVLDGKVIMVVDEVRSTGRTLDYAQELIAKAFPTTKVGGAYWMGGVSTGKNGLGMGNADTPVWYSDRSSLGRGSVTGIQLFLAVPQAPHSV